MPDTLTTTIELTEAEAKVVRDALKDHYEVLRADQEDGAQIHGDDIDTLEGLNYRLPFIAN